MRGFDLSRAANILGQPRFVQSSVSLFFSNQSLVSEMGPVLAEILGSRYQPPERINVPNEADPEVPRLLVRSQHGFSQIAVSQTTMVLTVQYSPGWQKDITLGEKYLRERVPLLTKTIESISASLLFLGTATTVQFPTEMEQALLDELVKRHGGPFDVASPNEVHLRLSSVIEGKYFRNFTIRNYRSWSVAPFSRGILRLSRENQTDQGLEFAIDFNDRFAFNEIADYTSSPEIALHVLDRGFAELHAAVHKLEQGLWL